MRARETSTPLIDPPRGGLFGYEAELSKIGIPYLIYVSCMPSVLARDLKGLNREGGYQVEEIQLYDMFPHTSHVESVVFLVRKERQG